jgi:phage shock protein PspC (stress-responsive transcriptional regulator)
MNDDTPNIEQPQSEEHTSGGKPREPRDARPRKLRRSSNDRILLGVAGGLGRYFDIDSVIFRIGFGLSIFFGGLGALAYLLLALFVPTDGDPDWAQRFGRRLQAMGFWRALGIVALAMLVLGGLFGLAGASAFAVALGWGVPVAIGIIVVGEVLALAGLRGGARWLIAPAVALAIGAGTALAANLDFSGGIGDREYQPLSARTIPADGYRLGVGRLVVDLRHLDWNKEGVVRLKVDLGAGQANVFVPQRVCVDGPTHVGVGESEVVGERNSGLGVDQSAGSPSTAVPRLQIDAHVDVGQLRVINSDTASIDTPGYGPGPFHEDTAPLRAAEARACATR